MAVPAVQEQSGQHGEHLILYDGVCGLCNRLNQFVLARDKGAIFDFAAIQSPLGRAILLHFGKEPDHLNTFYLVSNYRSSEARLLSRSGAALAVLENLGSPWRWLRVMKVLPQALPDWGYDLIARHRYGWFGQTESCILPASAVRHRFIDHDSRSEQLIQLFSGRVSPSETERDSRRAG